MSQILDAFFSGFEWYRGMCGGRWYYIREHRGMDVYFLWVRELPSAHHVVLTRETYG